MDTPTGPQEESAQVNTATHGGRVYAVQNGDQYNYIYRGAPPYRVEPFPLTEPAAVPDGLMRVPSRLLTARHQVVPFLPRPELAQLESWREGGTPGLSVCLVYAEGGSGKTRLAAEFAARSATAGWAVALARHHSEVASAGGGDQTLAVRAPGLVLVVDYAERWPLEDLITLVRQHQDAARDRLRILLLSRQAGNWWQSLKHQLAKLDVLNVDALRLEGLPQIEEVRAEMYTAARDRFIKEYKKALAPSSKEYKRLDASTIGVPDDLTDRVFGLTLTVHMRALVDVDAASRGKTPPTGSGQASLSSYLLDREHDHWRSFHHQGSGPLRTPEQAMGRAVYVATLTGPLLPADGTAALTRTRAAETSAAGEQLAEEHARCYPPTEPALVLDPLYPDRLGEDYLALTLPGHEEEFGYHATDSWTLNTPTALLAPDEEDGRPALYTRHALSVMIEAGNRWPHLTTQHLEPLLRRHPALALAAGGAALTRLANLDSLDITVLDAIRLHFPTSRHTELDSGIAAITARLAPHHLATTHDPAARVGIYENLSKRQSYAGLHDEALIAGQFAVKAWRDLTHTNPLHQPDLARSLSNLGGKLSAVGRREEALAAAEEAVDIRRGLAEGNPTAYNPALATSLSNLSAGLSAVGRRSQALAAAEEALEIRRGLAEGNPTAHLPDLATSLSNLSIGRWEAGRREEALAAAEEAVDIRRGLAEGNPTAHLPDLAAAMNNFGIGLWAVGRREEALAAAEEAVGIRRGLAEGNPTAHLPDLARSLSNLSAWLSAVGRRSQAPAAAEEAVKIYRLLAQANAAAYKPDLARSLSNLGIGLSAVGQREEALTAELEAVEIRRRLVEGNPTAYNPALATSLSNLSARLCEAGRHGEAPAAAEEAVKIYRLLAQANAAAYKPDLARSLSNLGIGLSVIGRQEEALTATEEAVEIYRGLAEGNRAAHSPDLAASLNVWAMLLAIRGDLSEALSVTGLAVECYRLHIATMPSLLLRLHATLDLQAGVLDALERPEEAAAVRRWLTENPLPPDSHI